MNRVDRLFAILLLLQRSRRIRATDLTERFGVSERTIYRDMRALNEMGVPVATLPGEGYELLETFRLPPVMLTSEEATALFLAGRMLMHIGEGEIALHAETALHKIESVLPTNTKAHVHQMAHVIDFYPAQIRLNWDEPHLMQIIQAIEARKVIHLTYRAYKETDETERDVEPHRILFGDGAWYLNGFCRLRRAMHSFRLNRISVLEILPEVFEQRMIMPGRETVITVKVRFNERVLPHVRERQHYAFSSEDDHGTMTYQVHTLAEIQNWLLGFGASAQVLVPDTLREWVREEAQKLIDHS